MSKPHTAEWHLKQAWKMMEEIATLPGTEGGRFLILKSKATKHVSKAMALDPKATINVSSPSEGSRGSVLSQQPSGDGDRGSNNESHDKD